MNTDKKVSNVNDYSVVGTILGSHLKKAVKPNDKKHFAIMEGDQILTPFELEWHTDAFNGVVIVGAGDKKGILAFDLGNIYIAPEYDDINEASVDDVFIFEKDGRQGRVTLQGQFVADDDFEKLPADKQEELEDIGFIFAYAKELI